MRAAGREGPWQEPAPTETVVEGAGICQMAEIVKPRTNCSMGTTGQVKNGLSSRLPPSSSLLCSLSPFPGGGGEGVPFVLLFSVIIEGFEGLSSAVSGPAHLGGVWTAAADSDDATTSWVLSSMNSDLLALTSGILSPEACSRLCFSCRYP